MRNGIAAALAAIILAPTAAHAQSGPYVTLHAGLNLLDELDLDVLGGTLDLDYRRGFEVGGALGWQFDPKGFGRFRIEGEIAHQQHDLDDAQLQGVGALGVDLAVADAEGDGKITSFMVNGFVDLDVGWPVVPFIGIGAGVARVSLEDIGGTFAVQPLPPLPPITADATFIDDSDTVGAGQAIVGIGFDVTDRLTLGVAYRAFVTTEAKLEAEIPITGEVEEIEGNIFSQAVRAELRYAF